MKFSKYMNLNIRLLLIPLLIIIFLIDSGISASDDTGVYTFKVEDFESKECVNLLGGKCGSWEKYSDDENEWCTSKRVKLKVNGKKSRALELAYKVGPQDYNGYYSKLNGIDVRPYELLSFKIKGGKKFPETIKVELKNQFNESGYYYITKITKNKWEEITIPLTDFKGISDFSNLQEFVIVFEGDIIGCIQGSIILDDISFISSPSKYLHVRKMIREENLKEKKKFRDMANLPEDELLELISKKSFDYFWNEVGEKTGFVKDRSIKKTPSSIAATGFGLAAICIADYRNWITHKQAYDRVKKILTALRDKAAGEKGFYYHFIDMNSGSRLWKSEASSIDTALLLGGVITAEEYFKEKDIKNLAKSVYGDINWEWMMDSNSKLLSMGWNPESGFKSFILWDMFGEEMMMYILALGAPKNALPKESWYSFRRPVKKFNGYTYIFCESESMFTYQYSHAFIDFRDKHDMYADYWKNSISAVKSSIEFTRNHSDFYETYKEGFWGISASDGPDGYKNYGALKIMTAHDGTVAPYAICGSIPLVPDEAIKTIRKLLLEYGDRVWNDDYGFISSFNLDRNWFSTEHIGIDLGITLMMIENYRTQFVWNYFMQNNTVKKGLEKAGFIKGTKETVTGTEKEIHEEKSEVIQKEYIAKKGKLKETVKEGYVWLDPSSDLEYGEVVNSEDLSAEFAFSWDGDYLYFNIDVTDDVVIVSKKKEELYKDDCIELYISPNSEILIWGDKNNYQIGIAPKRSEKKPVRYSFFQKEDPGENIEVKVKEKKNGYIINAAIKWSYLKTQPRKGKYMGISVAVHDVDEPGESGTKFNWAFVNTSKGIKLGKLELK